MYSKMMFSLVAIGLFLFSSCNNAPVGDPALNNGEKWKVNAEMMPPLTASNKLVAEFVAKGGKDYKALAKELKNNNKVLISSCTMSGKSHDELHKWLHPYMGLIDEMANAKEEAKAQEVLLKIEESFKAFNKYFE